MRGHPESPVLSQRTDYATDGASQDLTPIVFEGRRWVDRKWAAELGLPRVRGRLRISELSSGSRTQHRNRDLVQHVRPSSVSYSSRTDARFKEWQV